MRTVTTMALAIVATLGAGGLVVAAQPGHAAPQAGAGYWHTSGNQILDSTGAPVRIAGVNWYGFETPDEVVHGLWAQDYHAVVDDIRNLGYNTIRIPFSNQMVETPVVPQNIGYYNSGPINTDLKGLNSLQILDKIIDYAGQDGLKVILDDHRSEAGESAEQNGLWYTSAYPDSAWVNDWSTIARRYAGNSTVIGFDLRNEPHTPAGVAYAQGATWGTGDANTDIRLAYQRAGNAVLAADPSALIFCEGISENPNSSGGFDSTWWGGDLVEAGANPVQLSSSGHVVYSAHDYGPDLFQQSWFNSSTTSASLDSVWNKNWGYLYAQGTAPVWVGEFGTGNTASAVSDSTPGSQGQWFSSLVGYLHGNPWMGWTYWALNGEDSYALLDGNYDPTPASAAKQQSLATIQFPLSSSGGGTTTPPPPPPASCSASYSLTNTWAGGFQAQVVVTNTGSAPINGWTVSWTFPGDQKIGNAWSATVTQSGAAVTATNPSYATTIAPGGTASFGFTATYTGSNANPTTFTCD
jgi:endoglucanase